MKKIWRSLSCASFIHLWFMCCTCNTFKSFSVHIDIESIWVYYAVVCVFSFYLQNKYKEDGKKSVSYSVYSQLPETAEIQFAKAMADLANEVCPKCDWYYYFNSICRHPLILDNPNQMDVTNHFPFRLNIWSQWYLNIWHQTFEWHNTAKYGMLKQYLVG